MESPQDARIELGNKPGKVAPAPDEAPLLQSMSTDLESVPGLVIRATTQTSEAVLQSFSVPWEAANKYKIAALPHGRHAASVQKDPGNWKPTGQELEALPEFINVQEESSVWLRIALAIGGCLNLRPLKLHYLSRGQEAMRVVRPFRLGGCLGCPLEMTLMKDSVSMGKAVEDFTPYCGKCFEMCCRCTWSVKALEQTEHGLDHKYTLRTNAACCGRNNNCCGATCCKNDLIMDILDPQGNLVATVQKTYAPTEDWGACCRCCHDFSNYILEFPEEATPAQRALLTAALFNVEYHCSNSGGGGG